MLQHIIAQAPRFFTYYNLRFLLFAALTTIALSFTGCILGALAGLAIAVVRTTRSKSLLPIRILVTAFVEVFRRVPFLVTLLLMFFVFQATGYSFPLFGVALVSVFLIATAFISEIIRAGLISVHRNQWDAAATMNFNLIQTIWYFILPQAWKVILPPAFSFFVMFIKDSALASQIGVVELTYAAKVLNNRGFSPALSFGTVLILYFIISYPLARFGTFVEKRLAPTRTH